MSDSSDNTIKPADSDDQLETSETEENEVAQMVMISHVVLLLTAT